MPLVGAIAAALVGFLIPWRFGLEFMGRTTWMSAGDAGLAVFAVVCACAAPRRLIDGMIAFGRRRELLGPAGALLVLAIGHAVLTPAAGGGGPMPALATAWAILAGILLTCFDRAALLGGLRAGTWTSGMLGLLLLSSRPELVIEHKYFAAFAGAKNAFAFFAAVSTLAAAEPAIRGRAAWSWTRVCEIALGVGFLALCNARAAAAALGAALLVIPGGGRQGAALRGGALIAAAVLLASAAVPWDRIHFAWAILSHADAIPIFGLGPGFGYGLDTGLKLLLELGPVGFVALAALALGSLRRGGLTPWLALIAIYALAHDLARWPLFWILLLGCRTGAGCDSVDESIRREP